VGVNGRGRNGNKTERKKRGLKMGGKIEVEEKVEEVKGRASCLALSHKILDLLLCVKL